jgi:acyl-CoA thioesterase
MTDLDEALTLTRIDAGRWAAFADPRYESTNAMFGGWTTAIALRAGLNSADSDAKPSAITINFVERVEPGSDVHIRTRRVGGSRSVSHWQAEVTSADDERTLAVATLLLTDRRDTDGLTEPSMPHGPDPETLDEFHPPGTQGERVMIRPIVGGSPYGRFDTMSTAWVRELTGRPVDHLQLAFLADQFAPRPFFWSDGPRLSATLTMSVYFHATDAEMAGVGDDYILNEAVATRGAQSTSGQQARLWSRRGELLATSEQLCWYR